MVGDRKHIAFMDERRIFAIIERYPTATDAEVAAAVDLPRQTVYRFRRRNGLLLAKPVTLADRVVALEAWATKMDPTWKAK